MTKRSHNAFSLNAFSLVELSIVLVILGLLTGGILAGQSLIRAAEMRAITRDANRYTTSVMTFRDKYLMLPGDLRNATAFWGFSGGAACANNSGTVVTNPGTCDGNGNGILTNAMNAGDSAETFQGWRQLALAGLVEGSYSGRAGTQVSTGFNAFGGGAAGYDPGVNAPKSTVDGVSWGLGYFDNRTNWVAIVFPNDYTNWLTVGGATNSTFDVFADNPFLKPEEAWNIDTKMDDGRPSTGKIHGLPFMNCVATLAYNLPDTTGRCALLFDVR